MLPRFCLYSVSFLHSIQAKSTFEFWGQCGKVGISPRENFLLNHLPSFSPFNSSLVTLFLVRGASYFV